MPIELLPRSMVVAKIEVSAAQIIICMKTFAYLVENLCLFHGRLHGLFGFSH
jgi:hypothetical protein